MNVQLHERPVPKHEISSDDFGSDFSQASMGTRLRTGLHRVFRPRPKAPARSHDKPIRAELFSVERLEQHAGSLAAVQSVAPKPTKDRRLERRLQDNDRALRAAYHATISAIHSERGISPAANWLIDNVGTFCAPHGPCLIPVAPGLSAPSGVLVAGLALILRDLVQRRLGLVWSAVAIGFGSVLSATFAPPALVVASTVAFGLSETADLAVYTPLQRKGLVRAAFASGVVGLVVDSVFFLGLAFGSLEFLPGQIVAKLWIVMLTLPALQWLRERDRRLGLWPA